MKSKVENGEVIEEFWKKFNDDLNCPTCNAQNFNEQDTEHADGCLLMKIEAFITNALNQQRRLLLKEIRERIEYGQKYRLGNKEDLRSGWAGVESGECCEKCRVNVDNLAKSGRAVALRAMVGCRNPFQLKEVCECHLPYRKVAEESIQRVLKEFLTKLEKEDG